MELVFVKQPGSIYPYLLQQLKVFKKMPSYIKNIIKKQGLIGQAASIQKPAIGYKFYPFKVIYKFKHPSLNETVCVIQDSQGKIYPFERKGLNFTTKKDYIHSLF